MPHTAGCIISFQSLALGDEAIISLLGLSAAPKDYVPSAHVLTLVGHLAIGTAMGLPCEWQRARTAAHEPPRTAAEASRRCITRLEQACKHNALWASSDAGWSCTLLASSTASAGAQSVQHWQAHFAAARQGAVRRRVSRRRTRARISRTERQRSCARRRAAESGVLPLRAWCCIRSSSDT